MSLGLRRRLMVSSLVLVTVTNLGLGLYLEARLRGSLQDSYRDELGRRTAAMREAVRGQGTDLGSLAEARQTLDPLADRFGAAMDSRVSIVDADGALVGDSQVALDALPQAENHSGRAEIAIARRGELGIAQRYSATTGTDMLYVAGVVDDGSGRIVRVSVPLSRIDAAIVQLRVLLLLAGLMTLAVAGFLAMLASRLMTRSLRSLITSAQNEAGAVAPSDDDGDGDGEPQSVTSLAHDLRRSMRQLGTERARFEAVLETMGQAVVALDSQLQINTANRAARALLALPKQVEGRPLLDFARVPALQEMIGRAVQEQSANAEFDFGTSPQRRIQAQATSSRAGAGLVVVMHDVTELRRLETVRKDFVANVSHELRTPVAVIQANAETLLGGAIADPERAGVFLDALVRHADRLGRLVADLLDISRIEAGRYSLEVGPVDLVELVDRTFCGLSTPAEKRSTTLRSELTGDWWVAADDKALEQVLVNLVSNAIKYTQEGGEVEIAATEFTAGPDGDATHVRVEVRDDGPGIDPRHHQRVFERFYRVDSGRAREMGGTGLGLAIVKHLVEAMGGGVGVDARRPRGSVFWFTLPTAASVFGGDEELAEVGELADE